MSEGGRSVPMEALLEIAGRARATLRRQGVIDEHDIDLIVPRALAAAAGIHAGLAGLEEPEARRVLSDCIQMFGRAYEASAAAGQHNKKDRGEGA